MTLFKQKFMALQETRKTKKILDISRKIYNHQKPNIILSNASENISYRVKDDDTGVRYYVENNDRNTFAISMTSLIAKYTKNKSLEDWKKRVGVEESTRIAKFAADNGKIHHSLCEMYLKNTDNDEFLQHILSLDDSYIDQFIKVVPHLQNIDNILSIEQILFSKKWLVAGTADIIAEYNNIPSIIDHKTSSKEKPKKYVHNYFLQETGYSLILEEMTGIKINNLVTIISVFEDGKEKGCQVFIEKTDNYKDEVLDLFKKWESDK